MAKKLDFTTRVIHAGQRPDPCTGAIMLPIYTSSTYAQQSPGRYQDFEYSRSQNPTRFASEYLIADLENGFGGIVTIILQGDGAHACYFLEK